MRNETFPEWTEIERVAALDSYNVLDTPREEDFDDLAQIASQVCGTPIAVVNLVSTHRQFFKAEVGLGVRETPLDTSFCGHAILAEDLMVVPDATKDSRFDCNPLVTGEPGLRFYAGALLKTPEGLPIGTMCVLDFQPRTLDEHQIRTLRLLARQAMTQLELRRSLAERDRALQESRLAERRRADLARELAHRMKNMLAMVQAIATQTFRQAKSVEEGRDSFSSRLTALSKAQDILTQTSWKGAGIRSIVDGALAPHRTGDDRIAIQGPDIDLTAQQGLGLSLVLHELATNATKYGALSTDAGRVQIGWRGQLEGAFEFDWTETRGPTVEPRTHSGFGSRLIERIIAPYFDGSARLDFDPDGVTFRLVGSLADAEEAFRQQAES